MLSTDLGGEMFCLYTPSFSVGKIVKELCFFNCSFKIIFFWYTISDSTVKSKDRFFPWKRKQNLGAQKENHICVNFKTFSKAVHIL
mmetsp:Transcript_25899/g.62392  ORF Transcript_25899/g.62392 Transcript_25899/m.62392 type:complete len:86 (-) Transcript_25899:120-377(-)